MKRNQILYGTAVEGQDERGRELHPCSTYLPLADQVYPAPGLRVVKVEIDDDDEDANELKVVTADVFVAGMLHRHRHHYRAVKPRLHGELSDHLAPDHAGLLSRGWAYLGVEEDHVPLAWFGFGEIDPEVRPLDTFYGLGSLQFVVGPASNPPEWWAEQIEQTSDLVKSFHEIHREEWAKEDAKREREHEVHKKVKEFVAKEFAGKV